MLREPSAAAWVARSRYATLAPAPPVGYSDRRCSSTVALEAALLRPAAGSQQHALRAIPAQPRACGYRDYRAVATPLRHKRCSAQVWAVLEPNMTCMFRN